MEMMDLAEQGKIGTIIVKDHSRLGRNRLVVGQLLEEDFERLDVRYIAVMDNIDTAKGISDLVPMQDLFNEWHAKNTSQKVRNVLRNKGLSGAKIKVFRATDKQGIVLKTEYDAEAAFLTLYMGEQERRFFHALCYAVGAEKALLQAVFRARIWRGKGFIPYPPKPRFYCVTNPKQRSYELWQFSEWNGTRATP